MNNIIVNKKILFLILFLVTGCSNIEPVPEVNTNISTSINTSNITDVGCPEQPKLELEAQNVREISLNNQTVNQSSQVNRNKTLGYTFQAEAGQKLSYSTDDNICIWVYAPNTELISGTELPETGKYTIQVSALKGATTFDLEMSLNSANDVSSQEIEETSNTSTTSREFDNTTHHNLTKEKALSIVSGWYEAKPKMFAYPYDEDLVNQYATGKLYYETVEKDGGGSIGWLKRNNCYYLYDFSNIDNVWLFSNSGMRPLLKVQVSEKLQLQGSSSAGCNNRPQSYQKNVSYWFKKDNGEWKIAYYDVE